MSLKRIVSLVLIFILVLSTTVLATDGSKCCNELVDDTEEVLVGSFYGTYTLIEDGDVLSQNWEGISFKDIAVDSRNTLPVTYYNFSWPVDQYYTISSGFIDRTICVTRFSIGVPRGWHRGIDIVRSIVPPVQSPIAGKNVKATVNGKVVNSGYYTTGGYGNVVAINTGFAPNGIPVERNEDIQKSGTLFEVLNYDINDSSKSSALGGYYQVVHAHLAHRAVVAGDIVSQNQTIGTVGGTPSWPVHLHYEVKKIYSGDTDFWDPARLYLNPLTSNWYFTNWTLNQVRNEFQRDIAHFNTIHPAGPWSVEHTNARGTSCFQNANWTIEDFFTIASHNRSTTINPTLEKDCDTVCVSSNIAQERDNMDGVLGIARNGFIIPLDFLNLMKTEEIIKLGFTPEDVLIALGGENGVKALREATRFTTKECAIGLALYDRLIKAFDYKD